MGPSLVVETLYIMSPETQHTLERLEQKGQDPRLC